MEVEVVFASELQQAITDSLHVWVLLDAVDAEEVDCPALVAAKIDPYDVRLTRLADVVSLAPDAKVTLETHGIGSAFVYVEGVSITGQAELAGCVEVDVVEPSATATVTLSTAGVYDCGDPATEDDDPCDDGSYCTVGERCSDGRCEGGASRDCSALADDCNAVSCSETVGCETSPVPNGTPCQDGLSCTTGDACQDGQCGGPPIDCDGMAAACEVSSGCNEAAGQCIYSQAVNGTACDDDLFCTAMDQCSFGTCDGVPLDCSLVTPGDDCNLPSCDETNDACITIFALAGTSCDASANECTAALGTCNAVGACNGVAVMDGTSCNGGLGTCQGGTCI